MHRQGIKDAISLRLYYFIGLPPGLKKVIF
jgi:hypothetical protein